MKVVILAGGYGTRLSEETEVIPKPMIMIGDKPILHHIMDIYLKYGYNDFVIAAGYKWSNIIAYFIGLNPKTFSYDYKVFHAVFNDFEVRVVDTGLDVQTGGRIKRLEFLLDTEPFLLTYGDGLSDVHIGILKNWHILHTDIPIPIVSVTAVPPIPRFGTMDVAEHGRVITFGEKSEQCGWINGGFMVMDKRIFAYIDNDQCNLEKDVLPVLANQKVLAAFRWTGFWHCIDTKRDLDKINEIYRTNGAVWLK